MMRPRRWRWEEGPNKWPPTLTLGGSGIKWITTRPHARLVASQLELVDTSPNLVLVNTLIPTSIPLPSLPKVQRNGPDNVAAAVRETVTNGLARRAPDA
jgi:hypothetical protein